MTRIILVVSTFVVAAAVLSAGFFLWQCTDDWCFVFQWQKMKAADSFERCSLLGFPVLESYPRQCRAGDRVFTEKISGENASDKIRVSFPAADDVVASPLTVRGEARGNWYFEASFPVRLLDAEGHELAAVSAQAESDWMTTEFVPFSVTLNFGTPATETGTLVLQKDNPSGLPEHDDSISIPVRFWSSGGAAATGTLLGTMTIGPVCPVERPDMPCLPTPEMFAARKVFVYKSDRTTLVATLIPDANGRFSAALPMGDYWVDMAHQGVGATKGLPQAVHIEAGKATTLRVDVDTGIR